MRTEGAHVVRSIGTTKETLGATQERPQCTLKHSLASQFSWTNDEQETDAQSAAHTPDFSNKTRFRIITWIVTFSR